MQQSTWNWASQHKLVCRNRALYMFCWGMNLKCLTKAMRISCHSDLWMSMWRDACTIALEAGTPAGCVSPKQRKRGLQRYKPPRYKSFSFWKTDYLQDKILPKTKETLTFSWKVKEGTSYICAHIYGGHFTCVCVYIYTYTHTHTWSALLTPLFFLCLYTHMYFTHSYICIHTKICKKWWFFINI